MTRQEGSTFQWELDRPLAVLDIESTGTSPRADRIVELAIVTLMPDLSRPNRTFRINPQIPIPPEATAIHGIRDQDVASCPTFPEVAPQVKTALEGCDLAGYNIVRYDLLLLAEEFLRADMRFDVGGRRIVDAQRIFHRREPRDLTAALAYYCGEMHLGAHGAEADVRATIRVLEGQFQRYADLPRNMDELDAYCNPRDPNWVDRTGRLRWSNGQVALNFGKKKGETLRGLIENDPGFIHWLLRSDFPIDFRDIVENAQHGKWPVAPSQRDGN